MLRICSGREAAPFQTLGVDAVRLRPDSLTVVTKGGTSRVTAAVVGDEAHARRPCRTGARRKSRPVIAQSPIVDVPAERRVVREDAMRCRSTQSCATCEPAMIQVVVADARDTS